MDYDQKRYYQKGKGKTWVRIFLKDGCFAITDEVVRKTCKKKEERPLVRFLRDKTKKE